jgi:hypothetical protein
LSECASEKPYQKQRTPKNGTNEIEVMPGAVRLTPPHTGKWVKRFSDVREHNYDQTGRAKELQKSPDHIHAGSLV